MIANKFNFLVLLSFALLISGLSAGCSSSSMRVSGSSVGVHGQSNTVRVRDVRIAPEDAEVEFPVFFVLPEHVIDVAVFRQQLLVFGSGLKVTSRGLDVEYAKIQSAGDYSGLREGLRQRVSMAEVALGVVKMRSPIALGKASRARSQWRGFLEASSEAILGFLETMPEEQVVALMRSIEAQIDQCVRHLNAIA